MPALVNGNSNLLWLRILWSSLTSLSLTPHDQINSKFNWLYCRDMSQIRPLLMIHCYNPDRSHHTIRPELLQWPPDFYVLPSFQINGMKTKFIPCPLFLYHFSMTPISLRVKASVLTEATRSPVLSLAPGPSTPIPLLFLQQATHMPSPGGSHLLLILSGLLLTESPQACSHVLAASPPISFTRVHLSPWEFHDLKNYTVSYFLILSTGHKTQEDRNFILSTTLSSASTKCQAHSNY